jgi:hypothetical protein
VELSRKSGGIGSAISSMLAWCGGAVSNLVDEYTEERTRLASIGATVLSTGLFAAASSAYALSTLFGIGPWTLALALLWGATIFNIDRLIVMTMRGSTFRRVITAIPRLVLATVVAFVISRPLELWIFSPEIERGLVLSEGDARKVANDEWASAVAEADQRYGVALTAAGVAAGVPAHQAKLDAAMRDVRDCEAEAKRAADEYKAEVDGTGGSKHEGDGPIAKVKSLLYLEVKRRCDNTATVAAVARTALDNALQRQSEVAKGHTAAREQEIRKATASLQQALDGLKATGLKATPNGSLLRRHQQLGHLAETNASAWWMISFITALFWLIESLPVLAKLMAGESIYDSVIEARREAALAASRGANSALSEHETAARHAAQLAAQVRDAQGEAAAKTQRAVMELRYAARQGVIDVARERWKPSEQAVSDALSELSRDAHFTLENKRDTAEPPAQEPLRESHPRRLFIVFAVALGFVLAANVALFQVFRFVGPFARAPLNAALAGGGIVTALVIWLLSRLTRTRLEETE